jgi:hypothetical protein
VSALLVATLTGKGSSFTRCTCRFLRSANLGPREHDVAPRLARQRPNDIRRVSERARPVRNLLTFPKPSSVGRVLVAGIAVDHLASSCRRHVKTKGLLINNTLVLG